MVDVVKIVIDYLSDKLGDSVYVSDRIPNPRPNNKMVIIDTLGGKSSHYTTICENDLALQFFAESETDAYKLALSIHSIMPDIADEVEEVYAHEQNVPYNTTINEPRYQLVIKLKTS